MTVTYRGPVDPLDGTTQYRYGEHLFVLDVPVEDVPEDVARALSETKNHRFDVESADEPPADAAADASSDGAAAADQQQQDKGAPSRPRRNKSESKE